VYISYGQLSVQSGDVTVDTDMFAAFRGQRNGLCGAATPGGLWLTTSSPYGGLGFTAEVHDEPPTVDEFWEDIVEVSFTPASERVTLREWAGWYSWPLALDPMPYRVRYSAAHMDEARFARETPKELKPDCYLLQFWPGVSAPDRVLKQTSRFAVSRNLETDDLNAIGFAGGEHRA
jgi:hypothetical protein